VQTPDKYGSQSDNSANARCERHGTNLVAFRLFGAPRTRGFGVVLDRRRRWATLEKGDSRGERKG